MACDIPIGGTSELLGFLQLADEIARRHRDRPAAQDLLRRQPFSDGTRNQLWLIGKRDPKDLEVIPLPGTVSVALLVLVDVVEHELWLARLAQVLSGGPRPGVEPVLAVVARRHPGIVPFPSLGHGKRERPPLG